MKKLFIFAYLLIGVIINSSFTLSPFSAIVSSVSSDYNTYQIKVTYTSVQTKNTPSLLLVGSGRTGDISEFTSYYTTNIFYGNDGGFINNLSVSGISIKKLIDALNLRPDIKISGGYNQPFFSLMIERGLPPNEVVFEHLCDYTEAYTLLNLIEASISTESANTKETLRRFRNYTNGQH